MTPVDLPPPWRLIPNSLLPSTSHTLFANWALGESAVRLQMEMELKSDNATAWVSLKAVELCCGARAALSRPYCPEDGIHGRVPTHTFELGETVRHNVAWWVSPDFEACRNFVESVLEASCTDPLATALRADEYAELIFTARDELGPQMHDIWAREMVAN